MELAAAIKRKSGQEPLERILCESQIFIYAGGMWDVDLWAFKAFERHMK